MKDKIKKRELKLIASRTHRGRTELYRYLRANHAALVKAGVGTSAGPSWRDVVEVLVAAGQKNRKGEAPSADSLRRIFATVTRDLAAESAGTETARSRASPPMRAGAPVGWTPVQVTPAAPAPSTASPSPARPGSETEAEAEARAEANLARMRSIVAERSGGIQPKRGNP